MLFVVIASAVLLTVLGAARDPTKVCFPDVFQTLIFPFQSDITGLVAYDFPNKVIAVRSSNGYRSVYNLSDNAEASINEKDGTCIHLQSDPKYQSIPEQCLPANAVHLGNITTYVGLGSSETEFEGWEFQIPGVGGTTTVAVTTTTPAIPILRKYSSEDGNVKAVIFFFNAKTSIDDADIFKVPDNCTPATVVG